MEKSRSHFAKPRSLCVSKNFIGTGKFDLQKQSQDSYYRCSNCGDFVDFYSRKHQKKEKAIEKINGSEAESGSETKSDSESISSCNIAEKRKIEDNEIDESDSSSKSSLSYNDHVPLILEDIPKR